MLLVLCELISEYTRPKPLFTFFPFIVLLLHQTKPSRASTITIVRFPYLSALNNKANFLYATTNVGVLSTIEIGIGITTVAAVTIRPLFRHFLGPSQLDSSSIDISLTLTSHSARGGHVRNHESGPGLTEEEHIDVTTSASIQVYITEGRENKIFSIRAGKAFV